MRRFFPAATVIAALALSAWAQNELTIGVDLSTTGPGASLGIGNKNSTLLGPATIAGLKVNYIYLDDASDPTLALQNVKRLISEDNIDVLLGPSITPTSLAIIDTVAGAKVPTICYGSTSQIILPAEGGRKWMFKMPPNDDVYVNALVRHMLSKGVKTLSIVAVNDSFGESWIKATTQIAGEHGIKILHVERFERGDASTTPQALRIVKDNPDAVLIAAVGTPAFTPHRSIVERNYKGLIYQSGANVNPDFLRGGGKIVEGSYTVQSPVVVAEQLPEGYPTKKAALEWLKLYEPKYGPPAPYAAYPWDAMKLLKVAVPVALKTAKPGTVEFREALRSALENVKGVVGAAAVYTMTPADHNGVDKIGMAALKIENGNWKLEQAADFRNPKSNRP